MHNQPKFVPQRGTSFYADGRSARPQVLGTVARSQQTASSYFDTGLVADEEADGMPVPVTAALLQRGQERYNIYCSPCHSRTGLGHGMIVQRGYYSAASLHSERLRQAPLGHFFNVITNGYGAMPDYASQTAPIDRWAIAAYIRALQLSQNAKTADVPSGTRTSDLSRIAEVHGFNQGLADQSFWHDTIHARVAMAPVKSMSQAVPVTVAIPNTTAVPKPAKQAETSATESSAIAKPAMPKPAANEAVIAAGQKVYEDNCSVCHQSNLAGRPPKFPSLVGVVSRTGEEHVKTVVTNGVPDARPMMPSFDDRLSSSDISALIAFLKNFKQ